MSRALDQIAADPKPGDRFINGGLCFEVIGIFDGGVSYRVERVKFRRPSWMTLSSWKKLATETFTRPWEG